MKKIIIIIACLGLASCTASSSKKPILSGLELQQLQTREFEAPYEMTFKSVMSVLQDAGYILENADLGTGFITGKAPSNTKLTYNIWTGFRNKNHTTKISSTIEKIGQDFSKVRLNFVAIDDSSLSAFGPSRVDTPIEDPEIYENVFEKISETIFIRMATEAPAPDPAVEAEVSEAPAVETATESPAVEGKTSEEAEATSEAAPKAVPTPVVTDGETVPDIR